MTDKLNAERLRALDEAATAGPWHTQQPSLYREDNGICIIGLRVNDDGTPIETPTNGLVAVATQSPVEADEGDFERAAANAALLTYLRNAVPAILAMAEERHRMREDAARYHWLRDHSCPPHNFYISVPDEFAGERYGPSEVDAYIDEARRTLGKDQA